MAPSTVVQIITCAIIHSGPVGDIARINQITGRADIFKIAMIITLSINKFELGELDFSTDPGYR